MKRSRSRARIPLAHLSEERTTGGQRYLIGDLGWAKIIVVEKGDHWGLYLSGAADVLDAAKKRSKRARAPKAPRRATAKKQRLTPQQRYELLTAKRQVPVGVGFELNDSLEGIGG